MTVLAYILLFVIIVIPAILGIWWLLWQLWLIVLPAIWATGPENLIRPSYWLFVGMLLLLSFIGRVLFGNGSSK